MTCQPSMPGSYPCANHLQMYQLQVSSHQSIDADQPRAAKTRHVWRNSSADFEGPRLIQFGPTATVHS